MPRSTNLAIFAARFAVASVLTLVSASLVQPVHAAGSCDLSDLDGTFSYVVHGTDEFGHPIAAAGTFEADGAGNIAGFRASVQDGVYGTANFTCTYAMSANCSFRGPCIDVGEAVAEVQLDGALADNGKEIMLLMSRIPDGPGGPVVSGYAKEQ